MTEVIQQHKRFLFLHLAYMLTRYVLNGYSIASIVYMQFQFWRLNYTGCCILDSDNVVYGRSYAVFHKYSHGQVDLRSVVSILPF